MMHSNLSNSCFYDSYILYSFMMELVSYILLCHFKLIYQPQILFVKSYLLILSLLLSCMILLFEPIVLSLLFVKKIVKIKKLTKVFYISSIQMSCKNSQPVQYTMSVLYRAQWLKTHMATTTPPTNHKMFSKNKLDVNKPHFLN
jgi:hypothetical protein